MGRPQRLPCAAVVDGLTCWRPPVVDNPVSLCRKHLAAVMHQATRIFVAADTVRDIDELSDEEIIGQARVVKLSAVTRGHHSGAVYFVQNGSRIKIGYTTNLRERITTLSLRPSDVLLLLSGDRDLESALHRHFGGLRIHLTEWFHAAEPLTRFIEAHREQRVTTLARQIFGPVIDLRHPVSGRLTFPDGGIVSRNDWPDLYEVFIRLCEEDGHATKDLLTERGPYSSRDTVRRAVDHWLTRGVQVRKSGRTDQFYLPELASEGN